MDCFGLLMGVPFFGGIFFLNIFQTFKKSKLKMHHFISMNTFIIFTSGFVKYL